VTNKRSEARTMSEERYPNYHIAYAETARRYPNSKYPNSKYHIDYAGNAKRDLAIYKARRTGRTLRDVGKEFGIAPQSVTAICLKGKHLIKEQAIIEAASDLVSILQTAASMRDLCIARRLSSRITCHLLSDGGWNTLPVRDFVHITTPERVLCFLGIGKKSITELRQAIHTIPLTDFGYWKESK